MRQKSARALLWSGASSMASALAFSAAVGVRPRAISQPFVTQASACRRIDLPQTFRELFRPRDHEFVIQKRQRLRSHIGDIAAGAAQAAVRGIERLDDREPERPLRVHVHAAPQRLAQIQRGRPLVDLAERVHFIYCQRRNHGRSAHFRIQCARTRQNGVAHFLGVEPRPVHAPEIAVLCVGSGILLVELVRHPVRVR